jgi:predicted AlkP superfamily phosphohydrolase/phosphomutase
MASKARVMVLALDAADPALVRELAAEGEMPAMAAFLAGAAEVNTRAPVGVFVSANWPTIFTATSPDRHRYLCWNEYIGGTYDYRETDPTMMRGTPFWETLSEAGKRVAVLDVPHTVVRPLNGLMLCEWGCHDRHLGTGSWPPELADELSARHGSHLGRAEPPGRDQFAPCDYVDRAGRERTDEESIALFHRICEGLEAKRHSSLELLDRGGWDLFLNVLGESHCIGHQLWHLHDPAHPRHDPALAARLEGDPVRAVYRRLDAVIGEHLARLGPEDTAYVCFPHGMTAHNDGAHLFDNVLHRLEWSLDDPGGLGRQTRAAAELARLIPRPLRGRALRAAAPLLRARTRPTELAPVPPPSERRWFAAPNNTVVGAVRLNLAGREPHGRVHPADRREALRWLSQRLLELVNVDTGGRVIRRCVVSDDVYRRSPDDAFGDLYVEWERSHPIERVWSPSIGTVSVPYDHWRQGDHVREGLVLAKGRGIRPGRRRETFDTWHLGATFSAAAGVALAGVDGQPIASIVPRGAGWKAPRRGAAYAARAKARVGRMLDRSGERRTPAWAQRQDPSLVRAREDLTLAAGAASDRAWGAYNHAETAHDAIADLDGRMMPLERASDVAAMTAWLPHARVPEDLLISVVMPTRNRMESLPAAVASVEAQSYNSWELLIVDDGSIDATGEFLSGLDDPRVRRLSTGGIGPSGARNAALEAAYGAVITYLDDDNLYDPHWLKAVAWTFQSLPDTTICYGVRVFDDEGRALRRIVSGRPAMHFEGWDADAILTQNLTDMNVLAHRRGPIRFDEGLAYYADWDLLLRLARNTRPVELPAIAAYYRTDAHDRLSYTVEQDAKTREYEIVRQKLAADSSA